MNAKKFLATIISTAIVFVGVKVGAVGMPASELMRLDEAPRGEIARPMQQTLTSENSGLNPGYSVTPIQNTRPVAPDDVLPNVTATAAIVIEASTGHVLYERQRPARPESLHLGARPGNHGGARIYFAAL